MRRLAIRKEIYRRAFAAWYRSPHRRDHEPIGGHPRAILRPLGPFVGQHEQRCRRVRTFVAAIGGRVHGENTLPDSWIAERKRRRSQSQRDRRGRTRIRVDVLDDYFAAFMLDIDFDVGRFVAREADEALDIDALDRPWRT
jgi:hypothetical protein